MTDGSELSARDRAVLAAVFGGEGTVMPEEATEAQRDAPPADSCEEDAARLDAEAVAAAEAGRLDDALEILRRAIGCAPAYPSPYNDRAQVLLLLGRTDEARADLDTAVRLASGGALLDASLDGAALRHPRVLARALCQRGHLFMRSTLENGHTDANTAVARRDFEAAARLGDADARRMAAQLNPYAKLCAQMVSELMQSACRGAQ